MQHTLHAGRQVPELGPPKAAVLGLRLWTSSVSRVRTAEPGLPWVPARCALPRTCRALPSPGGRVCPCVRTAFSDTLSGDTRMGESNMNDASVQLSHLLGARKPWSLPTEAEDARG